MFLFPRLLSFDFSYDLDLWAEGQALRSFFIGTSFAIILYDGEFDQTCQKEKASQTDAWTDDLIVAL